MGYDAKAYVAKVNDLNSARSFCLRALEFMEHEEKINEYQWYSPAYAHKLMNIIHEPKGLQQLFESEDPVFIVMKEREYDTPERPNLCLGEGISERHGGHMGLLGITGRNTHRWLDERLVEWVPSITR